MTHHKQQQYGYSGAMVPENTYINLSMCEFIVMTGTQVLGEVTTRGKTMM